MHKARLPHQSGLGDTVETFASSPRGVSKVDPAYFGYWSKEEVLKFLNDLIETERIGLRAFAAIGRAADLRVANLVLESELAQGAICVLLKKEIARRGGARTIRKTIAAPCLCPKCSLQRTVAFACTTIRSSWQT